MMTADLWSEWKSAREDILITSTKYGELEEWARKSPDRVHVDVLAEIIK